MTSPSTSNSTFSATLNDAEVGDLEFFEEHIPSHDDSKMTRVGCRPIRVRGVSVPDPKLVVYVRATGADGCYWYVLDWSQPRASAAREIVVESELDARYLVLKLLKAAHDESAGSG